MRRALITAVRGHFDLDLDELANPTLLPYALYNLDAHQSGLWGQSTDAVRLANIQGETAALPGGAYRAGIEVRPTSAIRLHAAVGQVVPGGGAVDVFRANNLALVQAALYLRKDDDAAGDMTLRADQAQAQVAALDASLAQQAPTDYAHELALDAAAPTAIRFQPGANGLLLGPRHTLLFVFERNAALNDIDRVCLSLSFTRAERGAYPPR